MDVYLPETMASMYDGDLWLTAQRLDISASTPLDLAGDLDFCFLCFTNRCGSNFFAQLLASSGQLNEAQESYGHEEVLRVAANHGLRSFREYVSQVARSSAIEGRFVVKTSISHIVLLAKTGVLRDMLPRADFILLERIDKLAQAISLSIAEQTKQWASFVASAPSDPPKYEFDRIISLIHSTTRQMQAFDEFFALNGLVPTHVTYESISADPLFQAADVAQRLGIRDANVDLSKVNTKAQRSRLNDEWRSRFLSDIAVAEPDMSARASFQGGA